MTILGYIQVKHFLEKTDGAVKGALITDAKHRFYSADYRWEDAGAGYIVVYKANGTGDKIKIKSETPLDESLVSFFGLYSGDGSKGGIAFSQRENHLVKFAVTQFKRIFAHSIRFVYSIGEDCAYFMEGDGYQRLKEFYNGSIPVTPDLKVVRPELSNSDQQYLAETRPVRGTNEKHLAFYYHHRQAIMSILAEEKRRDMEQAGVMLNSQDRIEASVRRPFKKGAREPGRSSRSDELRIGGLSGMTELFLKILHEIEESIFNDCSLSTQGLVQWLDTPSNLGQTIKLTDFFARNDYGQIGGERPLIRHTGTLVEGRWPRSSNIELYPEVKIDPLWCYVSGLYLAEGSTDKKKFFSMFDSKPLGMSLSFTSSENISVDLLLRALQRLCPAINCLNTWKIKVGSQYFPELVVIGIKNGVPMLRGGVSGDGKLRTMEISLSLKDWALETIPALLPFEQRYSHVEPTGAGVARVDFSSSSALCKWFFPLIMYATFGNYIPNPREGF
jgi:hypothetical protein